MPMDDMESLEFAAKLHGFRQPTEGEREDVYRNALANHVEGTGRIVMNAELDNAMVNLSVALGGGYAEGAYSDDEMVMEAIRLIELAKGSSVDGRKMENMYRDCEVFADKTGNGDWRVEAVGQEGEYYVTLFSGPFAKLRARHYALFAHPSASKFRVLAMEHERRTGFKSGERE